MATLPVDSRVGICRHTIPPGDGASWRCAMRERRRNPRRVVICRMQAESFPHVSRLLTDGERDRLALEASEKLAGLREGKGDTTQMIASHDVIKAGAVLWGGIMLHDVTRSELAALQGGLMYACEG